MVFANCGHPSSVGLNMMRWLYPSQFLLDLIQLAHTGRSSPHLILLLLHVKHPVFVLLRNLALLAAADAELLLSKADPKGGGGGRIGSPVEGGCDVPFPSIRDDVENKMVQDDLWVPIQFISRTSAA